MVWTKNCAPPGWNDLRGSMMPFHLYTGKTVENDSHQALLHPVSVYLFQPGTAAARKS